MNNFKAFLNIAFYEQPTAAGHLCISQFIVVEKNCSKQALLVLDLLFWPSCKNCFPQVSDWLCKESFIPPPYQKCHLLTWTYCKLVESSLLRAVQSTALNCTWRLFIMRHLSFQWPHKIQRMLISFCFHCLPFCSAVINARTE